LTIALGALIAYKTYLKHKLYYQLTRATSYITNRRQPKDIALQSLSDHSSAAHVHLITCLKPLLCFLSLVYFPSHNSVIHLEQMVFSIKCTSWNKCRISASSK